MRQHTDSAVGTVAYMGGVMSLPEPFVWSWTQMMQFNTQYLPPLHYMRSVVSYHSLARNRIVDEMRGEWVLMLDTDIAFSPDILHRLLLRMEDGWDIVTGVYQFKREPYAPLLYRFGKDGMPQALRSWTTQKVGKFHHIPIESAGAGCLLVKTSVFDRILTELRENPFDIIHPLGEDHSFFWRVKRLEIGVGCDPAVTVEHLTYRGIQPRDYQRENVPVVINGDNH